MKTLNTFYLVIYWTQKVHNDIIFLCSLHCVPYKCSSTQKCMHTASKKFFWMRVQPFVHCLLQLFVGPERLAYHCFFEWSRDMEVTGGARSGEYGICGRHSNFISWIVATVEQAVWGQALSCWSKTPVLRLPRRLDLIEGRR